MKRRIVSILAALALCLGLLPGTARAAEGDPAVKINDIALEDGKKYVASGDGVAAEDGEIAEGTPYLEYSGGTLTVCGAFAVTGPMAVNANLTITGGVESSLEVNASDEPAVGLGSGGALTLDGGVNVNFTSNNAPAVFSDPSAGPLSTFNTTNSYSGAIGLGGNGTAVSGIQLNVQSSGSITIEGDIEAPAGPMVLNSTGDIAITRICPSGGSSPLQVKIKGANVIIET